MYFISAVLYGVAWGRLVWSGSNGVRCTVYLYGGSIVLFVPVLGLAKRYSNAGCGWYALGEVDRYGTGTVPVRYRKVRYRYVTVHVRSSTEWSGR